METLTITLQNEHARRVIESLQAIGVLTIESVTQQPEAPRPPATFNALNLDTRGFKFNREEANER